nr:MAG TPA: hypothetical protein [Caudoviricetes sp.]
MFGTCQTTRRGARVFPRLWHCPSSLLGHTLGHSRHFTCSLAKWNTPCFCAWQVV